MFGFRGKQRWKGGGLDGWIGMGHPIQLDIVEAPGAVDGVDGVDMVDMVEGGLAASRPWSPFCPLFRLR